MNESKGLFGFLEKYLMGPMGKISQYKFVRAIMATGMAIVPFTIVGSMFLVLNVLPLVIPSLSGIFAVTLDRYTSLYMMATTATMGTLALFFNIVLGYEFTKIYTEEDGLNMSPLNGALLSMFAFLMTIPQFIVNDGVFERVVSTEEGAFIINGWAMGDGVQRFSSAGIFAAIIMAVIAVQLYRLCIVKNWIIKMPESVPEGVSRGFTALIPAFIVAFTVIIANGILISMNTDIFQVISAPFGFVTHLTNSWLGLMVIYFIVQALWLVGIHGASIVFSIITPITLMNLTSNAVDGTHIPLAGEFGNMFVTIGGSGATLGLCIYLAYMAKSEQLKVLGKAGLVPAIFNINEPLIFGMPLIYNPFMAIPFIIAPMVSATIAYFAINLEIIRPVIAQMPWPSPVGIGAFIGTGGDWKAAVVAVICALAAFAIYYPFIKAYDQRLLKEESEAKMN
ncbi:PTS system, cellobiose-specific IIC component [Granulicatella balaenopterae]|uniref:Permease IIC component n=1 Tax=Granulicatella balaenopterae TaxID=137733 RepID=A0A1H9N3S5_9LACT|nr:PTS cellobiose transporter subunit IIC [Granulicatella balaenopterae]SER30481.1 PTS system, cellobiose-specific IIC component [Granulicatella balaenopterae]